MNTFYIILTFITLIVFFEPRVLGIISAIILFLLICIFKLAYTLWIKSLKKEYNEYSFTIRTCKYLGGKLDFIREKFQE